MLIPSQPKTQPELQYSPQEQLVEHMSMVCRKPRLVYRKPYPGMATNRKAAQVSEEYRQYELERKQEEKVTQERRGLIQQQSELYKSWRDPLYDSCCREHTLVQHVYRGYLKRLDSEFASISRLTPGVALSSRFGELCIYIRARCYLRAMLLRDVALITHRYEKEAISLQQKLPLLPVGDVQNMDIIKSL